MPELFVVAEVTTPVSTFRTEIAAPDTTAPLLSVMVPVTRAWLCASAAAAGRRKINAHLARVCISSRSNLRLAYHLARVAASALRRGMCNCLGQYCSLRLYYDPSSSLRSATTLYSAAAEWILRCRT